MSKDEAARLLEEGELLYSHPFIAVKIGDEIKTDCPDGCCECWHDDIDQLWEFRDDWEPYFPAPAR